MSVLAGWLYFPLLSTSQSFSFIILALTRASVLILQFPSLLSHSIFHPVIATGAKIHFKGWSITRQEEPTSRKIWRPLRSCLKGSEIHTQLILILFLNVITWQTRILSIKLRPRLNWLRNIKNSLAAGHLLWEKALYVLLSCTILMAWENFQNSPNSWAWD